MLIRNNLGEKWMINAEGIDPKTGEKYKPATFEITNSKNRFAKRRGYARLSYKCAYED